MPSSSTALRQQIETALQHRYPSALTPAPKTIREFQPIGISQLDELLNGGLPVGAISELTGLTSSGRTSIALSFVAQFTREERVCAWIDAGDSLDPESAAANGVSLNHLLWVRCTSVISTPSHPSFKTESRKLQPWTRLDQALRATDLLLQSGGFSAIVLDLGNESIEHARRIPLATWFRFRQGADRTRCSLIVIGKASYAQSSAAVVLECERGAITSANNTVIRTFSFNVRRGRVRYSTSSLAKSAVTCIDRKPPASTWSTSTAWNAERRA